MAIERTYHCEDCGEDCGVEWDVRLVHLNSGQDVRHFCSWDCVLKFTSKQFAAQAELDRQACAENGHMTSRRSHETAWGEPVSPLVQSPDFCFRCGGVDVSFDWREAYVPFEAETWGTPIEHEPEHEPDVPPDLEARRQASARTAINEEGVERER